MERTVNARSSLVTAMILGAAVLRIVPHPPNFTPIAAIALFGGAHLDRKRWAFAVPLAAMLLSDLVLQILFGWGLHGQLPIVYATFAGIVCLGLAVRDRRRPLPVAGAALGASLLLYLTTNFAVWAAGSLYPRTVAGLLACYTAGLPFLAPTIAGDVLYSAMLFGAFAVAERRLPVLARARSRVS